MRVRVSLRVVPIALTFALAFCACSSGGGGHARKAPKKVASTAATDLKAGTVEVVTVGPPAQLPAQTKAAIMATVAGYVSNGLVKPLRGGTKVSGVAAFFDAGAGAQLLGPDGAVLFDAGLPAMTGGITTKAPPVPITALADANGTFVLASTTLLLDTTAKAGKATYRILRQGELVLAPDQGAWKITGYDFSVTRQGPGIDTTTSTAVKK
jgi:hypothetical protein